MIANLNIVPKQAQVKKQIIALGGGGFSDDPGNPMLDLYIIVQSGKPKPRICFLPTASGDAIDYIEKFYKAYERLPAIPSHLSLTKGKTNVRRLESFILSQDIIFAGGGSPRLIMKVWRKTGMDKIIRKAWRRGIILSGMSAGAMCWFSDVLSNPKDDNNFKRISGLGLLTGSLCPHYNNRGELRKAFSRLIAQGELDNGFGVEDSCALHFTGRELHKVVSAYPSAKAYTVRKAGLKASTRKIKFIYLGAD
ncbi:MAG: peptidase E [Ignavibacteriae bacterium]|nr:MAG: peptidase E [Ignavibacteriota bacterium]